MFIVDKFEIFDKDTTIYDIKHVIKILNNQIEQIKTSAYNYASSQNTYNSLSKDNMKLLNYSIPDDKFSSNNWNILLIVNNKGNVLYSKGYDLINQKETSVSQNLTNNINVNSILLKHNKPSDYISGILSLPKGPAIITSIPINISQSKEFTTGYFIVLSYIDKRLENTLSSHSELDINIKVTDYNIPEDPINLNLSNISKSLIGITRNKNKMTGEAVIYDIYNNPAFTFVIDKEMTFLQSSKNAGLENTIGIIIIVIITLIAIIPFIKKSVIERLNYIITNINIITKEKDLSRRFEVKSNDEFSEIGKSFNTMLKSLQELNEKLYFQANHDPLTKLPNRTKFYKEVSKLLSNTTENTLSAIIFIDLDNFKSFNDTLGHNVGDMLLKEVTEILKNCISNENLLCRIGGDEFVVFLHDFESKKLANDTAIKILDCFKKPLYINDKQLYISSSLGISIYPYDGNNVETLVNNADIAMYRVKKERKNDYKFYNNKMRSHVTVEMLNDALLNNEFQLYYQPKINGITNSIEGMEALIRWIHPKIGFISPGEFIQLAEETGIINIIGEWVLRNACIQNKKWQDLGLGYITISVNISSVQFMQKDFISIVKNVLNETKLEPKYLELEITETVAIFKEDEIINKLNILKDMGIKISIDDFGTGYSSLSYLEKFPIDELKIDKTFVDNISINSNMAKIIIGMAQNLELSVTAEGVETTDQLDYLLKLGCTKIQGYLFSKPVDAKGFEILLMNENLMNIAKN